MTYSSKVLFFITFILVCMGCQQQANYEIASPDGKNAVIFNVDDDGAPYYIVKRVGRLF